MKLIPEYFIVPYDTMRHFCNSTQEPFRSIIISGGTYAKKSD